jgi:prepilin-type N-terminal cleavage/methylation domain-containing protein
MIKQKLKMNKGLMSGFTLIEMMVATSIFMMIMLVSMGSLIITLGAARDARALRFAMDNVNFAMESMTRSIRMGTNYTCFEANDSITDNPAPADCENGTAISFIPQLALSDVRITYMLSEVENSDGTTYHTIKRIDSRNGISTPIIASSIDIEKLNFIVDGSSITDNKQSSVYIVIKGKVMLDGSPRYFSIQTMASQRNFQ